VTAVVVRSPFGWVLGDSTAEIVNMWSLQAAQFNDRNSGTDVLVASDAVGMGLNLNIRRIIFSTLEKFDGTRTRSLTPVEIKQIAGTTGNGLVSCFF
jgi:hypothetical protein